MGTHAEITASASAVMTPPCGHVPELRTGLHGEEGPRKPLSFVTRGQQPGHLLSGHSSSGQSSSGAKGFHFDPIATVVKVDFPSRINGGPESSDVAGAFGYSGSGPAGGGPGAGDRQGLGMAGAAVRNCWRTLGPTRLDLEKDCLNPGRAQDETRTAPTVGVTGRSERTGGAGSMFFCCPKDQVVLRGAEGNRTSISTGG